MRQNKYQKAVQAERDKAIIELAKKGLTAKQIEEIIEREYGHIGKSRIAKIISESY